MLLSTMSICRCKLISQGEEAYLEIRGNVLFNYISIILWVSLISIPNPEPTELLTALCY